MVVARTSPYERVYDRALTKDKGAEARIGIGGPEQLLHAPFAIAPNSTLDGRDRKCHQFVKFEAFVPRFLAEVTVAPEMRSTAGFCARS
jgi:hypothetical protein